MTDNPTQAAPFKGPFEVIESRTGKRFVLRDGACREVFSSDDRNEAEWLCDRLNAAPPAPDADPRGGEREAFEADARGAGYPLERTAGGYYADVGTRHAWNGWKSRGMWQAALRPQPNAGVLTDSARAQDVRAVAEFAAGYSAGVETSAMWHETEAYDLKRRQRTADSLPSSTQDIIRHHRYAAAIRNHGELTRGTAALTASPTAQDVRVEIRGTMECPICGLAEPHSHNAREQAWYRLAQIAAPFLKPIYEYDSRRSYGCMAYACVHCDALRNTPHRDGCEIKLAIKRANGLVGLIGMPAIDAMESAMEEGDDGDED